MVELGARNQRGIYHGALSENQSFVTERGVDCGQICSAQPVLFEQVAKAQDADPVGNALDIGEVHKFPVQRGLGTRCVRRNQRQQFRPRHHQIHLVEEHSLARAPFVQIAPRVLLLYGHIVRR